MRSFLKRLAHVAGGLGALAGTAAAYVHVAGIPRYEPARIDLSVAVTRERVPRGRRAPPRSSGPSTRPTSPRTASTAAEHGPTARSPTCSAPASPATDAGRNRIYSANLTPDPTGLGAWSEADFRRALRLGLRPDGRPLRPPMPLRPEIGDDGIAAMWAYLRTVPALPNAVPTPFPGP